MQAAPRAANTISLTTKKGDELETKLAAALLAATQAEARAANAEKERDEALARVAELRSAEVAVDPSRADARAPATNSSDANQELQSGKEAAAAKLQAIQRGKNVRTSKTVRAEGGAESSAAVVAEAAGAPSAGTGCLATTPTGASSSASASTLGETSSGASNVSSAINAFITRCMSEKTGFNKQKMVSGQLVPPHPTRRDAENGAMSADTPGGALLKLPTESGNMLVLQLGPRDTCWLRLMGENTRAAPVSVQHTDVLDLARYIEALQQIFLQKRSKGGFKVTPVYLTVTESMMHADILALLEDKVSRLPAHPPACACMREGRMLTVSSLAH